MATVTRFMGLDYYLDSVQAYVMDESGQVLAESQGGQRHGGRAPRCGPVDRGCGPGELICVRAAVESCAGAAQLVKQRTRLKLRIRAILAG